jgi:prepilin peptidase CpaA
VKLFAAIGALSGTSFVWECAIISILYAGVIGIMLLLWKKLLAERIGRFVYGAAGFIGTKDPSCLRMKKSEMLRFPFMYAVFPAALTVFAEMQGWMG